MKTISLVHATHRPETLRICSSHMVGHHTVVLEEPPHPDFSAMLAGTVTIDSLLLEQDFEYPLFAREQYQRIRKLAADGVLIVQVEPYLEILTQIQLFFADGGSPQDLAPDDTTSLVYQAEKEATGKLLAYYRASRSTDINQLLAALIGFARADADRFRLRDQLRATAITALADTGQSIYVEAGTMHLLLADELARQLPPDWTISVIHAEEEIFAAIDEHGPVPLLGPGDELTACLLLGRHLEPERQMSLAAQALIYAKLITKEEGQGEPEDFPHTRDELLIHRFVRPLTFNQSCQLYGQIKDLSTTQARRYTGCT